MRSTVFRVARFTTDFLKDDSGPTSVEYAIMMTLIIIVCVTTLTTLGANSNNTFSYVGKQVGKTGGS
jgi:pilus assembly protein Flp/PilA